jgi:hypothetical protein
MPVFRVEVTNCYRKDGHALGLAAYRAREKLHEVTLQGLAAERGGFRCPEAKHGKCHDFTRHHGAHRDVQEQFIRLPEGAPAHMARRNVLWSCVELAEGKRKNARNAREVLVSLPHELSPAGRSNITHAVADFLVERYRVAVDAVIHAPPLKGDERHHHVHLLCSTRRLGPNGFEKKTGVLDHPKTARKEVEAIREKVAEITNAEFARWGMEHRVDHRSGRRQLSATRSQAKRRQQDREATASPQYVHAWAIWRKLDHIRRHAEDPEARDRTTKLEIADRQRAVRHQTITERIALYEARIGRKSSRREQRLIAKKLDHHEAIIAKRQPIRVLTAEQIKQMVAARKARDAQTRILEPLPNDKPEIIASKLDHMRDLLREMHITPARRKAIMDETRTAPKDNDNQPGKDAGFDKDSHDKAVANLQERLQDLERSRGGPESVHDKVKSGIAAILEKTKEREMGRSR